MRDLLCSISFLRVYTNCAQAIGELAEKTVARREKAGYVLWIKYDDYVCIPYDIRALAEF